MTVESTIGTGKDYATVALWRNAIDGAVLQGEAQTGIITGLTEDNATVFFNGFDGSANIARLEAASGQEADGTDAKGAQIDSVISFNETTNQLVMEINGVEFHTGSIGIDIGADNATSDITITKCVFRDLSNSGINIASCADVAIKIGICLFRDMPGAFDSGIRLNDASVTTECKVLNCTAFATDYGIVELNGIFTDMRNVAACCKDVNANYDDFVSVPSNMDYCASSGDGTATGANSIDTLRDDGTDFTNTAGDDFTLKDTNAVIYGTGQAIVGEGWFPGTDLVGTTWNSPPSMGCFEFAAAADAVMNQLQTANLGADLFDGTLL